MTESSQQDASRAAPKIKAQEYSAVQMSSNIGEPKIVIIAGEHSGDILGGKLMAAINASRNGRVRYFGVGGATMAAQGLVSQFPMEEVAVMGIGAIMRQLPRIVTRVYQSVDSAIASEPDVVVIIDAPEFTHPIAKRIRRKAPHIPIVNYVSPSVWAWRPWRARKMSRYIDHVLALLPFEPDAHQSLGGPPCDYVGHPLAERLPWIKALDVEPLRERLGLQKDRPVVVVLPGSRSSEVSRLIGPFGETMAVLAKQGLEPQVIVPVVEARRQMIEDAIHHWPWRPHIVSGEEDKFRSFRLADAALAASGTVTLELAVAGTPMVVGYRLGRITAAAVRPMIKARSAVLANLVLNENAFPEFIQEDCQPEAMAKALALLLSDRAQRQGQLQALARIPEALAVPGPSPSQAAAEIVLYYATKGRASDGASADN